MRQQKRVGEGVKYGYARVSTDGQAAPFFASGADNYFVLGRRLFLSFFRSSPL
jgi:hypothetical protein